jgi:diguanylate cyclase (GGDEF)-like protein
MSKIEFSSLEMAVTVPQVFKMLAKDFSCKNMHWISKETLERLSQSDEDSWRWTLDSEQDVQSYRPVLLERLFELWKQMSPIAMQMKSDCPEIVKTTDKNHILVPVVGPQFGRPYAFVLFEDLKGTVGKKAIKKCEKALANHAVHLEFCWQYSQARTQSYMDDLTSLYNQRYLPTVFDREIQRMGRLNKKFSVLFMDIDFFKRINDTRGHWIGSKLLIEVAKVIKAHTRACDCSFRYGGDEFLTVLVDSSPENSHKVAERIRAAVEQTDFVIEGETMKLTLSIGLAVFPDHAKSTVELIKLADQAMYYGKRKSRNIVFLAG